MEKKSSLRASYFKVNSPIWPKIELFRYFTCMSVLVTRKFDEDPIKNERVRAIKTFCTLQVNGKFDCHGIQSSDLICPKTLYSIFPTPLMLHIKFDQYLPTCHGDI